MQRIIENIKWKLQKFKWLIQKTRVEYVVMIPLIPLVLILWWKETYGTQYQGTRVDGIMLAFSMFFAGCAGLIIILRKEYPSLGFITGIRAVILGVLLLVICWGFAIGSLIIAFSK